MTNELNVNVLVSARSEYTNILKKRLSPLVLDGFISIWEDAVEVEKKRNGYCFIKTFQEYLKDIPQWNQTILEKESNRIQLELPWLMKCVTAICVSHVKILGSIKLSGKHENIKIVVPTAEILLHSLYIRSAEIIYSSEPIRNSFENHFERKSKDIIKKIIEDSIDETISSFVPIKNILDEYLSNIFNDHINEKKSHKERLDEFNQRNSPDNYLSANDMGLYDPVVKNNLIDNTFNNEVKNDMKDVSFKEETFNNDIKDTFNNDIKDTSFNTDISNWNNPDSSIDYSAPKLMINDTSTVFSSDHNSGPNSSSGSGSNFDSGPSSNFDSGSGSNFDSGSGSNFDSELTKIDQFDNNSFDSPTIFDNVESPAFDIKSDVGLDTFSSSNDMFDTQPIYNDDKEVFQDITNSINKNNVISLDTDTKDVFNTNDSFNEDKSFSNLSQDPVINQTPDSTVFYVDDKELFNDNKFF